MSKLNEFAIVYVDDEVLALKYFEKGFAEEFHIFTASNAADAWEIIQEHASRIGVVMSDQRMPRETGVELLQKVRQHYPHMLRIIVTAFADFDSAVAAVNSGGVYRYIGKPWDVNDLRFTLLRALEFFSLLLEREQLVGEKLAVLQQIVLSDQAKNLGVLAAGLGCHFRQAVAAAHRFLADVPPPLGEGERIAAAGNLAVKFTDRLTREASHSMYRIASALRAVAEGPPYFGDTPIPLQTVLALLAQADSTRASGKLLLKIPPSLPPLKLNQKQAFTLFRTLLSNLRSVAGTGGSITIEAEETAPQSEVKSIQVRLSDEGPEWTGEQRRRFFAPFATGYSEPSALGLDLAVCYFIAHHHGGRIEVIGKPRPRVTVQLPLDPLSAGEAGNEQNQLDDLFSSARTLDEFLMRKG